MGRNFADEDVQRLLGEQRYAYTVKPLSAGSEHSVAVVLDGKEYTPEQINAKILEKIKLNAIAIRDERVDRNKLFTSVKHDKARRAPLLPSRPLAPTRQAPSTRARRA